MEQFSKSFTYRRRSHIGVLQPRGQRPRFGLFRFRSPLLTESHSFSLPPVTEMFHFTGCRVSIPILFRMERLHITGARLPHSEISGSKPECGSPKLIAAYHVLHRLLAPRHSLYALNSLIPFLEISLRDRRLIILPRDSKPVVRGRTPGLSICRTIPRPEGHETY